jgi:hypothetical protein
MLELVAREAPDLKQLFQPVLLSIMVAVVAAEVAGTQIVKQLLEQAVVLVAAVVVLASHGIHHLQWGHQQVQMEQ